MIKHYLLTLTSSLSLMLAFLAYPQRLLSKPQKESPSAHQAIAKDVGSRIGEFCFWAGIPIPATEMRMVIFEATESRSARAQSVFDALVIVPDANAMYQYRLSEEHPVLVFSEEQIRSWPVPGSKRID